MGAARKRPARAEHESGAGPGRVGSGEPGRANGQAGTRSACECAAGPGSGLGRSGADGRTDGLTVMMRVGERHTSRAHRSRGCSVDAGTDDGGMEGWVEE